MALLEIALRGGYPRLLPSNDRSQRSGRGERDPAPARASRDRDDARCPQRDQSKNGCGVAESTARCLKGPAWRSCCTAAAVPGTRVRRVPPRRANRLIAASVAAVV